jgi:hypothetical protein
MIHHQAEPHHYSALMMRLDKFNLNKDDKTMFVFDGNPDQGPLYWFLKDHPMDGGVVKIDGGRGAACLLTPQMKKNLSEQLAKESF